MEQFEGMSLEESFNPLFIELQSDPRIYKQLE